MKLAMHPYVLFFGPSPIGGPMGGFGPMGGPPGHYGGGMHPGGPPPGPPHFHYGGNPMHYHHSFHHASFYGFMHAPGFYYAGPMHHHPGGWSFGGPFWGYRGYAGPEFYFGRAHDPIGPQPNHGFVGSYYHGWWRGYGLSYPSTWCGGWFGLFPMGAPASSLIDDHQNDDPSDDEDIAPFISSPLLRSQFYPARKPGIFEKIANWWQNF